MANDQENLSYKFQRLRERLRQAIQNGELAGKLPGERELARRFDANPKTLSKALTDLAAEGLLERSIGRGTFVRGAEPVGRAGGRWLIVCDPGQAPTPLIQQFVQHHPDSETAINAASLRPSFISQFSAVVDLAQSTPESFHRGLLVRGISVVLVNREPTTYKLHAAVLDRAHAATCLSRDLFLAGHRRILVIEESGSTIVSGAARMAASRYAPHAAVESCTIQNAEAIADRANTAILCDGEDAALAIAQLAKSDGQLAHLAQVSLVAIGMTSGMPPCTGIYATAAEIAQAAAGLLQTGQAHRPTVLWLTGTYIERGTIHAVPESRFEISATMEPRALSA